MCQLKDDGCLEGRTTMLTTPESCRVIVYRNIGPNQWQEERICRSEERAWKWLKEHGFEGDIYRVCVSASVDYSIHEGEVVKVDIG